MLCQRLRIYEPRSPGMRAPPQAISSFQSPAPRRRLPKEILTLRLLIPFYKNRLEISLSTDSIDTSPSVPSQPWQLHIYADYDHNAALSPTNPIPWADWDVSALVLQRILHFSSEATEHLHPNHFPGSFVQDISKHDALLAHMWTRINAARLDTPETQTYLNMIFGLRPRLSPLLPDNFLGNLIRIAAIPPPPSSSSVARPPLSQTARQIRSTLQTLTPSASQHISTMQRSNTARSGYGRRSRGANTCC